MRLADFDLRLDRQRLKAVIRELDAHIRKRPVAGVKISNKSLTVVFERLPCPGSYDSPYSECSWSYDGNAAYKGKIACEEESDASWSDDWRGLLPYDRENAQYLTKTFLLSEIDWTKVAQRVPKRRLKLGTVTSNLGAVTSGGRSGLPVIVSRPLGLVSSSSFEWSVEDHWAYYSHTPDALAFFKMFKAKSLGDIFLRIMLYNDLARTHTINPAAPHTTLLLHAKNNRFRVIERSPNADIDAKPFSIKDLAPLTARRPDGLKRKTLAGAKPNSYIEHIEFVRADTEGRRRVIVSLFLEELRTGEDYGCISFDIATACPVGDFQCADPN